MESIGSRLRSLRGKDSARKFGEQFDQSQQNIYRYERGERKPPMPFLEQVAKATGVSLDWLISGTASEEVSVGKVLVAGDDFILPSVDEAGEDKKSNLEKIVVKLISRLELCENERREVSAENRQLHKDKESLLHEIYDLKTKLMELEERLKTLVGGRAEVAKTSEGRTA